MSEFKIEYARQKREHPDHLDFTEFDFPHDIKFDKNIHNIFCSNVIFRKKVSFLSDEEIEKFSGGQ